MFPGMYTGVRTAQRSFLPVLACPRNLRMHRHASSDVRVPQPMHQQKGNGRGCCLYTYWRTHTSHSVSFPFFLHGLVLPASQVGPGRNWLDRQSLVGPSSHGPSARAHGGRSNPDCTEHPVILPGKVVETLPEPRGLSCRRVQRRPCLACLQENTFSTGYQP